MIDDTPRLLLRKRLLARSPRERWLILLLVVLSGSVPLIMIRHASWIVWLREVLFLIGVVTLTVFVPRYLGLPPSQIIKPSVRPHLHDRAATSA